jgi:phosphohistidine phosphatase SixA
MFERDRRRSLERAARAWPAARWFLLLAITAVVASPGARADEAAAWEALRTGGVVALMRHARAPGVGDPADMKLEDCRTQRNLSEAGRAQARRIGEAFRERGVSVERVLSSAWCRSLETARLAFGEAEAFAPLNSFFGQRKDEPEQTRRVRAAIAGWRGPGALAMVTHQVNITALTQAFPQEGEVLVLRPDGEGFTLVGKIPAVSP